MKRYLVGGAVRDRLLGAASVDRDWVVVGSRPQELLAAGFVPVGADFPVFLHPQTKEEHALARTERKTAPGYAGFAVAFDPTVTLEEDLLRRDLTINAMAQDESGAVIDPFGGRDDLAAGILRHVSPAFAEDPVRILRLARFAARFPDFRVAESTCDLMRSMVASGEVDALVPERVWQELARGLMSVRPSRMFEVLRSCGALARLLPEVDRLWGVPQPPEHHPEVDTGVHLMMVLDVAAQLDADLAVRFACLGHDLGKGETPSESWPRHLGHEQRSVELVRRLCTRLRVPSACRELAELVAREHGNIHRSGSFGPSATVRLLERCDAFRRRERFAQVLLACECDARGRLGRSEAPYPQRARLEQAAAGAAAVDTAAVAEAAAARGAKGPAVGLAVPEARVAALVDAVGSTSDTEATTALGVRRT